MSSQNHDNTNTSEALAKAIAKCFAENGPEHTGKLLATFLTTAVQASGANDMVFEDDTGSITVSISDNPVDMCASQKQSTLTH